MPSMPEHSRKRAIVVCGPTASGKSEAADRIADLLNLPTVLIDSMQVYREIPEITNQNRDREAFLRGIISIEDEWNVALHRKAAREIVEKYGNRGFVADAGTGMYLNAVIMDIKLSPRAPTHLREKAALDTQDSFTPNRRRQLRQRELELMGETRGSIWNGELLYQTTVLYIRPSIETLKKRILARSLAIAEQGCEEARRILDKGLRPNASVRDSIGLSEMLGVARGELSQKEATDLIARRTGKLARNQRKWFDKLTRKLDGKAREISIIEDPHGANDIINSWNLAERYW